MARKQERRAITEAVDGFCSIRAWRWHRIRRIRAAERIAAALKGETIEIETGKQSRLT